jgi:acyl-CoA thioesterase-1
MKSVFILGGSIAMLPADGSAGGYGHRVIGSMAHEAVVELVPENGEDSRNVLAKLYLWLGDRRFDVIHFNCGLHDLKRAHATHQLQAPPDEYTANLEQIVAHLRPHAGALVWARTTPVLDGQRVPDKPFDRFNADGDACNAIADRVMREAGVAINDLHGAVLDAGIDRCISSDGGHMTEFGAQLLTAKVVDALRAIHD